MKILFLGSFHGSNKGDEAILFAEIQFVKSLWPDAECVVASKNPTYFSEQYESVPLRGIKVMRLDHVLAEIRQADLVVIGGGGLFFEPKPYHVLNVKKNQTLFWPLAALAANRLGVPVVFLGLGGEPLSSKFAKRIVKAGLNKARAIIVRDHETANYFLSLGVTAPVHVGRDSAWLLPAPKTINDVPSFEIAVSPHKGISVIESTKYEQTFLLKFAEQLLAFEAACSKPVKWLFMPLHNSDVEACQLIMAKMQKSDVRLFPLENKTPTEIILDLASVDMQVGVRMHGTILSTIAGTPCIPIKYANKSEQTVKQIFGETYADPISLPYEHIDQLNKKMQFVFKHHKEIQEHQNAFIKKTTTPYTKWLIDLFRSLDLPGQTQEKP